MISKLFYSVRRKLCPKRIYKYGKVGLGIHDDRSSKEKLFDWIESCVEEYERRRTHKIISDNGFRPYFDWSLGLWINNRGAIKDIERSTGLDYVSIKDWEKESAKQKKHMEDKHTDKIRKGVEQIKRDINNGRSFVKENTEKRREIYKQYGRHK